MDSPKSQGTEIQFVNLGIIPMRTTVTMEGTMTIQATKGPNIVDLAAVPKQYTCRDCGWSTRVVSQMEDHQANHTKHHSYRQRWHRFWSLVWGFFKPKLSGRALIAPVSDE